VLRYSAVIIAALALAPQLLAWTPPERVDRRPEGYQASAPAVAVDPSGGVHAVWTESKEPGFQDKIMYARRLSDTWSIPAFISRDSGDIRAPRVISDTAGRLIVAWSEEGSARFRYVRQLGDTWSVPKLMFSHHGIFPRLVRDSRGTIHTLFEEMTSSSDIYYSYYCADSDSWAAPQFVASGPADLGSTDVVVDCYDRLHAVWMDWGTYGLGYARKDSNGWTEPIALPDPEPGFQSIEPNIAVDTLGLPHVAWEERRAGYHIHYMRFTGDSWTTPFRLDSLNGSLALVEPDDRGRMVVVWGWDDGLKYEVRTDTGWTEPEFITHTSAAAYQMVRERTRLRVIWGEVHWVIGYSEHSSQGACEEATVPAGPGVATVAAVGSRLLLAVTLARRSQIAVHVLDADGRTISRRSVETAQPGVHELVIGDSLPAGVYFCQVSVGDARLTAKAVVVR